MVRCHIETAARPACPGGLDGRVVLWQPGKFKKAVAQARLDAPVSVVCWSPDDRLLAQVRAVLAPVHGYSWPSGRPENDAMVPPRPGGPA